MIAVLTNCLSSLGPSGGRETARAHGMDSAVTPRWVARRSHLGVDDAQRTHPDAAASAPNGRGSPGQGCLSRVEHPPVGSGRGEAHYHHLLGTLGQIHPRSARTSRVIRGGSRGRYVSGRAVSEHADNGRGPADRSWEWSMDASSQVSSRRPPRGQRRTGRQPGRHFPTSRTPRYVTNAAEPTRWLRARLLLQAPRR